MNSAETTIWTVASDPDRSATAWAANPPICTAAPSSHSGWRASAISSRGRPAMDCGAAAA
jgi:hypothetical protein